MSNETRNLLSTIGCDAFYTLGAVRLEYVASDGPLLSISQSYESETLQ
ncbi:hypothetical protein I41_37850 [Lacipirellula limnantheis]|uniref:Uncharacterized protein n=1 Tax=Lacipirellula limnantheis TaxID=2528024 RepID=A0A517U1U9_9BACT|nr:hypothetical protein I41_37850 [Lacipirellula limnantheis]